MRVYGPNGTALATAPTVSRRSAGGTFSVTEQGASRQSAAAVSLRSVTSLDALIALQGMEDATERRKRSVAKGRKALDVLEKLKLGLLSGGLDSATLSGLKAASEGLTEPSGDPGLDQVMSEIDLRVAVELAKAGIA